MPTFYDQLTTTCAGYGDRPALVHEGNVRSWRQLSVDVDTVAAGLLHRGINRGDKIAVWLPNGPEWTIVWLAAASIGAAVVPLNTRYRTDEVAYVLRQSESAMLVTLPGMLGIDFRAMVTHLLGEDAWETGIVHRPEEFPALRHLVYVDGPDDHGLASFASLLSPAEGTSPARLAERRRQVVETDDVILVYTSGTTGFPKGARHDHTKLSDVAAMADLMSVTAEDRILAHMPNFHVGGAFLSIVTSLVTGAAQVCLAVFHPREALRLIAEQRCTVINGVPSHFIMMLTELREARFDLSSSRIGWIAGAMIPPEVVTGIRDQFGMNLLTMYGMTETTGVTTATRPGDDLEVLLTTVGTTIGDDYEVQVTNPSTGRPLPAGEQGEIWVRGHRVTSGYYEMPQETAESLLADGWFRTGDLGRQRDDGRLQITGRLKDMFIVGGTNTYPAEIEAVLFQLEAVEQAYVVGVPDERLGEVGMAFIQVKNGHLLTREEVLEHCAARMANYKRPRYVEFTGTFPMTATGKVQKYKLRDDAIKALHLEEVAARRLLDYTSSPH